MMVYQTNVKHIKPSQIFCIKSLEIVKLEFKFASLVAIFKMYNTHIHQPQMTI